MTDRFVPQISPITVTEFALWFWSINEANAVGFYNSNKISGASQQHKHLQLIPLDVISSMRSHDAEFVSLQYDSYGHIFINKCCLQPLPLDDLIIPEIESGRWKILPCNMDVDINSFVYHLPQVITASITFISIIDVFDLILFLLV